MIWLCFNLYLYWYFSWYPLLVPILVCFMLYCLNTGTGIVIPMLVLSNTGTVIVQAKSITHSWSGAVSITIQASTTPRPSCLHICFNVLILVSNLGSLNAQCFLLSIQCLNYVQCSMFVVQMFECSITIQASVTPHPSCVCGILSAPKFFNWWIFFCFYCHPVSSTFVSYKIDQSSYEKRWNF